MGATELSLRGARAVILGGGEIRDYPAVAGEIRETDFVICADSGFDHCGRLGAEPRLLLGDFDSVKGTLPPEIPRIPLPAEKNYTDLTHAVEWAVEAGCRRMLLAGVLGGRLDHTVANLQMLYSLSLRGVEARLTDGRTDAYAITGGELRLPHRERRYFSVRSLSEVSRGVYIRNARYPLTDYTLYSHQPRGVSNEFLDGDAYVSVADGSLEVICTPMDG